MRPTPLQITAIIPAYNEEKTIANVVQTLVSSNLFNDVIVVDDGSNDLTAFYARSAGANVICTDTNMGKGQAMKFGAAMTDSQFLFFCDADIIGLKDYHLRNLIRMVYLHDYDMCVGMRDKGRVGDWFAMRLPWISGERILHRRIIDAIPKGIFTGYRAEILLNLSCSQLGLKSGALKMHGVSMRKKAEKTGFVRAIYDYARMYLDVLSAYMIFPNEPNHASLNDAQHPNQR